MQQKIVYKTQGGQVAIITPITESGLSIEEIVEKDVPKGAAYNVVDASEIPSDRMFRDAWEWQD